MFERDSIGMRVLGFFLGVVIFVLVLGIALGIFPESGLYPENALLCAICVLLLIDVILFLKAGEYELAKGAAISISFLLVLGSIIGGWIHFQGRL